MKYFVIFFVLVFCIFITLFLVKETYTSENRKKVSLAIAITSVIATILSTFFSNFFSENIQNININSSIENKNDLISTQEQFVTLDGLHCFILSKNFEDTKISNSSSEFIFYNHSNNEDTKNTLKFSFALNQKYNYFASCISINDNINNTKLRTTIQIYADDNLIYNSEDLYNNSLPIYINLDLSDISMLSFTISTDMINVEDELFRTVIFSETSFE